MSASVSSDPLHLAVSKSKGITIDWADGHTSRLSNELLRDHCPCASCTGSHGTPPQRTNFSNPSEPNPANPFQMFTPKPRIVSVEQVGAYAIRIHWSDGHNHGIYSFEHLRRLDLPEAAG
ncbi:MAG: DUF971 domain-containing protein [Bryobacteraceae bacterium]|nr:DUF971 domain-containing protein [Bryobacteraceae bacterium]